MGSGVCEDCRAEFREGTQRRRFCSDKCRAAAWQATRKREMALALEEPCMVSDPSEPIEPFETWLLRRVAQGVEAGEVPAALLTELQSEIEATRGRPQVGDEGLPLDF